MPFKYFENFGYLNTYLNIFNIGDLWCNSSLQTCIQTISLVDSLVLLLLLLFTVGTVY